MEIIRLNRWSLILCTCTAPNSATRELKQRHLKIDFAFLQSFFNYSNSLCLKKCVLTIQELNWNQLLGHKRTKLYICHHMLTSSTQLQNRSFHVVERTRASSKCQKMKNARAKRAKNTFFIVKYANLWGFCCRRRRGCLSSLLSASSKISFRVFITNYKFPTGQLLK